jgi:hypothetical protein
MCKRFFATIVSRGRVHVRGIGDSGPWDRKWLRYRTEPQIDVNFNPHLGDRKVETLAELEAVIIEAVGIPMRNVWIHEKLEEEARRLWEAGYNSQHASAIFRSGAD